MQPLNIMMTTDMAADWKLVGSRGNQMEMFASFVPLPQVMFINLIPIYVICSVVNITVIQAVSAAPII
jgi:hypothetical protein